MKILLTTLEYPPFFGGVATYYSNIISHWPEKDEIFVLDNSNNQLVDNSRSFIKWWPAFKNLRQKLKLNEFDYLVVGHILPLGTAAYFLKHFFKFDFAVVLHGMDFAFALKVPRKRKLAKKILLSADKIICGNSFTANQVIDFLGKNEESKIFVVNPGVDATKYVQPDMSKMEALRQKYNLADKKIVLSIGRLVKRKGVDQIILAMSYLAAELPHLALVVLGTGPDEEYLRTYARSVGNYFENHIKFIGSVSDEEKWQWLNMADVFVMPSRDESGDYEGFGIVYLEAGLASKPVIAGHAGGVADAVVDGVTGFLVDPLDAKELAEKIKQIIDNPTIGNSLGSNGRDRAVKEFSWSDKAKKFRQVLSS